MIFYGHDILKVYNNDVQVSFTTSKTELRTSYKNFLQCITSRVAERLKTWGIEKLGSTRKSSELDEDIIYCNFLPSRNKTLKIAVEY